MTFPTANAQTPHDASNAPFVIHVDATSNAAPQRIPVDTDALPKKIDDNSSDVGAWEVDLCGCCAAPGNAFYSWCLPCCAAGDSLRRIGKSPSGAALSMFALYIGVVVFYALYYTQGRSEEYTYVIHDHRGYQYETYEPKVGFLIGVCVCAFVYGVIVSCVRNVVRHHYHIPGDCTTDCCAAFFCACCTVAQMSLHTELVTKKQSNEQAVSTLPAYSAV